MTNSADLENHTLSASCQALAPASTPRGGADRRSRYSPGGHARRAARGSQGTGRRGHAAFTACCLLALTPLLGGCPPRIGDDCRAALDCSFGGERFCDTTQPGGYCTIDFCDVGTCPKEAECVEFRFEPARLTERFCMRRCSDSNDCRDNYGCLRPELLTDNEGNPLARLIDPEGQDRRFCAALPAPPASEPAN